MPRAFRLPTLRLLARRYGPQDLAARFALALWAAWVPKGPLGPLATAVGAALMEWLAFYAVSLLRQGRAGRGWRQRLSALVREYGPAELLDLAIRPLAMRLGLLLCPLPLGGLFLGSTLADAAFYALAFRAWRRSGRHHVLLA